MLGDGKCMPVGFYGILDFDLRGEQDVRVTLTNVDIVPGLVFDIMSFNRMQKRHEIILNRAGASILEVRVRFKKFRARNYMQATRVSHDDARPQPPAMVAAMMWPGPPSSMNVNDFHNSLGHANTKALYETAKQMGIKLAGIQEYCHDCATAKAIKRTVPNVVDSSRESSRPFQRIFVDLAGRYPKCGAEDRAGFGGGQAAFVEFPNQFPDITFPARTKSYAAIWPEALTWMNDCLNITAAVHKDDKLCPKKQLCGKRRVKQAWPFMMPGFRHRNRPTKMHDKGERCFYLNPGNDHSFDTHKIITPAGIATYSAH